VGIPSYAEFQGYHSVGWEVSTSQSAVMLCSWGVQAGMAHSVIPLVDKRVDGRQNCVIPR